ncbi:hypothetical protein KC326_g52 [Hortaea werneckii]|nr:hypothetical protein KC326_g52 [Hortaea werneckii]
MLLLDQLAVRLFLWRTLYTTGAVTLESSPENTLFRRSAHAAKEEVWIGSHEVWTSATSPRIGSFPGNLAEFQPPANQRKNDSLS